MLIKEQLPSLQCLVVFEAAARHRNFTAAARELETTQSAVSQQIRGLEAELGVTLFQRVYRGVELTEAGTELLRVVTDSLQNMVVCIEKIRSRGSAKHLNVASDFAFAAFWLLPRLPEFRRLYPEIEVRLITSQERHLLLGQDIDVAVVFDEPHHHIGAMKLFGETVFPICSPFFLDQHGPIKSHKRLVSLPILKLRLESPHPWYNWTTYLDARNSQLAMPEPVMTLDTYTLVVQAAIAGQGIALGWGTLVDDLIDQGLLVGLKEFSVDSDCGYYVVEPQHRSAGLHQNQFTDWLLSQ